jgi:hypothetical protein
MTECDAIGLKCPQVRIKSNQRKVFTFAIDRNNFQRALAAFEKVSCIQFISARQLFKSSRVQRNTATKTNSWPGKENIPPPTSLLQLHNLLYPGPSPQHSFDTYATSPQTVVCSAPPTACSQD